MNSKKIDYLLRFLTIIFVLGGGYFWVIYFTKINNSNTKTNYKNNLNQTIVETAQCKFICSDGVRFLKTYKITDNQQYFLNKSVENGFKVLNSPYTPIILKDRITSINRGNIYCDGNCDLEPEFDYINSKLESQKIKIILTDLDAGFAGQFYDNIDGSIFIGLDYDVFIHSYNNYLENNEQIEVRYLSSWFTHEVLHGLGYDHPGKNHEEMYGDKGKFITAIDKLIVTEKFIKN
jgi:hypothetical protein